MTAEQHEIVKIAMSRSMCFGECPAYSFEVNGDGLVSYHGEHFVIKEGHHTWNVPQGRMRTLGKIIGSSEFFSTAGPSNENMITCVPRIDLSIEMADGRSNSFTEIYDWPVVDDLADRIDKYCGLLGVAYLPEESDDM